MQSLPAALAPLGAREQFVTWFAFPNASRPGKMDKFPCDWRNGDVCNAQDPNMWCSAEVALAMAPRWDRGHGCGAGFVFTNQDPFFFLDGDKMLLPDNTWSPLAQELTARLSGAACEVSHSGAGLHWFGQYAGAEPDHACRNTPMGLELYTSGRFVALTGAGAQGDAGLICSDQLGLIIAQYFPPSATGDFADWTTTPVPEWKGPEDDDELIRRARASAQKSAAMAFGKPGEHKPTFEDLWTANADVLAREWPHDRNGYGASEADMALANHLAFWTGKNCERMDRLMRQSALVRPKWDTHRTYMGDTILKACRFVSAVATGPTASPVLVTPPAPEVLAAAAQEAGRKTRAPGQEYMGPIQQLDHFKGCYFLSDNAAVFSFPHNALMGRPAFDVVYGGHMFIIDPMGEKKTDSAWEAFTKSRVNVPEIVNNLCFRPELEIGAIVREGPIAWVNSYVPYECPLVAGDVSPFVNHLAKMLPDPGDQAIILNYMASMVQNRGVKFQWWPVIQGVKGNGKTLILDALTYLVGEHYAHLPNAHAMARDGMKFNSWIDRKLFIGVEEIALANRRDFLDEFKIVVTNRRIPMEGKGTNQTNGDNRANGVLMTNNKDGVPVTTDERRYAIFYCAQQAPGDLERDGMGGEYFPYLYEWFRAGGNAVIAHYLKNFKIDAALDPARLAHRAPKTSSSEEAVHASLGRAEQEILEAIEQGRAGFAGGWVSSTYLDALLDDIRAFVPRNKRRDLMRSLGYDWHPVLPGGRVNDTVTPDGRKPKLYVRIDSIPALNLHDAPSVAAAYSKAQEATPVVTAAARAFAPPKAG